MRNKLFFFSLLIYIYSSIACADETLLKKSLSPYFPNKEIKVLKKIPSLQLYEIAIDDQLFYVDEKGVYFFSGYLFNLETQKNITEERLQEINNSRQLNIDSLPLKQAIKEIKGNGKRKIIIFSDPNCGYCKRLEKELTHINNVTIYTLLYPILKGSKEISEAIWCSDNKLESWREFMLNGKIPTRKKCNTPIDTILETGKSYGFNSTPTIIFTNGKVIPGMISAEMIEKELNKYIK
tara:strand:- start:2310 stop:3020 length:711 start_codon:yes stop_codon:yes gene_type:complete